MRGRAVGSAPINKLFGNFKRANSGVAQTFVQKCKMGSLAAPHFVHSSARVDAEGAKRGSLDRSDLIRNSALFVRRSHTTSQYFHTGLTSPVIRPCKNQRKRKIVDKRAGGSQRPMASKNLRYRTFGDRVDGIQRDDAAPSRMSCSTRSTSAGTSTLIAS